MQKLMVIWDTGSGDTLIKSKLCSDCVGDRFDQDASSSFTWLEPTQTNGVEYMDGSEISGSVAVEKICPTSDTSGCADQQQFTAADKAEGFSEIEDGIVGMWSGNKAGVNQEFLYMNEFARTSGVTEKTFSFYMTNTTGQSYLDFGTPNPAAMAGSPIYIPYLDDNEWFSAPVSGFKWGSGMPD